MYQSFKVMNLPIIQIGLGQILLGYTFWKGIGLGFEFGLRDNKQEALSYGISQDATTTFDTVDNKLQSYWLLGISYNIK